MRNSLCIVTTVGLLLMMFNSSAKASDRAMSEGEQIEHYINDLSVLDKLADEIPKMYRLVEEAKQAREVVQFLVEI